MNTQLNDSPTTFTTSDLPALVSGAEKHGASHLALCLMVDLFRQGNKVVIFSAFAAAKDDFKLMLTADELERVESVGPGDAIVGKQAVLVNPGDAKALVAVLGKLDDLQERVILVKNIERFSLETLDAVRRLPHVVYSGDADDCPFADELATVDFATKIFFTPSMRFPVEGMPALEKYQGYAVGTEKNGVVTLQE
ncbi:MAG: hypothetical protein WCO25_03800 [Candidatus Uhrbacteria bacterium]